MRTSGAEAVTHGGARHGLYADAPSARTCSRPSHGRRTHPRCRPRSFHVMEVRYFVSSRFGAYLVLASSRILWPSPSAGRASPPFVLSVQLDADLPDPHAPAVEIRRHLDRPLGLALAAHLETLPILELRDDVGMFLCSCLTNRLNRVRQSRAYSSLAPALRISAPQRAWSLRNCAANCACGVPPGS